MGSEMTLHPEIRGVRYLAEVNTVTSSYKILCKKVTMDSVTQTYLFYGVDLGVVTMVSRKTMVGMKVTVDGSKFREA